MKYKGVKFTPEQIWEELKKDHPEMTLEEVKESMKHLVKLGLMAEIK